MNLFERLVHGFISYLGTNPDLSVMFGQRGRRKKAYSADSLKTYKNRLLTKSGLFPLSSYFASLFGKGMRFTGADAIQLKNEIERKCLKVETQNNKKSICRLFLYYLVTTKQVRCDVPDILKITMTEPSEKLPQVLSPEQRNILDNEEWSDHPFINLRNKIIYKLLERTKGVRGQIEPWRCNRNHVNEELWIVTIHGKGGKVRYIQLYFEEILMMKEYLQQLDKIIAENPDYPDKDALIIKLNPCMGKRSKQVSWRLDRSGIWAIYDRMRAKHGVLKGTSPKTSRSTRATHMDIVCRILGIPLEYADKILGNSIVTRLKSYDRGFDLEGEMMQADFDMKLLPLLEEIERYCFLQIQLDPDNSRHYVRFIERIRDKMADVHGLKIMVGRNPGFKNKFQSDSENDFVSLYERYGNKSFLPSPTDTAAYNPQNGKPMLLPPHENDKPALPSPSGTLQHISTYFVGSIPTPMQPVEDAFFAEIKSKTEEEKDMHWPSIVDNPFAAGADGCANTW